MNATRVLTSWSRGRGTSFSNNPAGFSACSSTFSIATSTAKGLALSIVPIRFFSSLDDGSSSIGDHDGQIYTGKVKFYLRDKAYGFVTPDDPSFPSDIWIHRTSIDTPHSPESFPTRPYLIKDERIQFQIEKSAGDGAGQSDKAINVRFANGRQIPLYRKNYHAAVVRGEMQRLGQVVYDLALESQQEVNEEYSSSSLNKEQLLAAIQEAVQMAHEQIQLAAERQEQYGPELDELR